MPKSARSRVQPLPDDREGPFQTQLRTPAVRLQSPAPPSRARFGSGLPLSGRGKRKSTHGRKRAKGEGRRDGLRRSWVAGCAPQRPEATRPTGRRRGNPDVGTGPRDGGPGVGVFSLRDCEAGPGRPVHAGNCSSPSLRDPFHRTRPSTPARLQRRPPQSRWRHLHELTSEGTSPSVMTSALQRFVWDETGPRLPQPRRSCSRRIQPGSDLGAFAPTRRGGTALNDLHQSGRGFLREATPPFRSANHEAPSASPTDVKVGGSRLLKSSEPGGG